MRQRGCPAGGVPFKGDVQGGRSVGKRWGRHSRRGAGDLRQDGNRRPARRGSESAWQGRTGGGGPGWGGGGWEVRGRAAGAGGRGERGGGGRGRGGAGGGGGGGGGGRGGGGAGAEWRSARRSQ